MGGGTGVATHPVAQLTEQVIPTRSPPQHSHRSHPPRTHTFHTIYDRYGKRVKKTTSTGDDTVFVYDAAGKLVEERNASTGTLQTSYVYAGSRLLSTETSSGTSYLTNDHLGSPRVNTDQSGAVTARHDYHPFGEEIARTGYGADTTRKQFTGYERDGETGLDFAQARYHSSNLGRFSSPDPLMASGRASSPQTWNRYPYVGNNPLINTDPTGLAWFSQLQDNGETIYRWYDQDPGEGWSRVSNFTYYAGASEGWVALNPNSNDWHAFSTSWDAADSIRYSLAAWQTNQLLTGASDAINPLNPYLRNAVGSVLGIDPNINEATDQYRGGWWTGLILESTASILAGGAASAETAGTGAATKSAPLFQRVVSAAELDDTQAKNMLRGGREGVNYFTNSASLDAKRAQLRLGLDGPLRDYRITFRITNGAEVSGPQIAKAGQSGTPGGGLEFFTSRSTQIQVISVQPLKK